MASKIKKIGIGLSIALNVAVIAIVLWSLSGGLFYLLNRELIQPIYVRSVSQFELLDMHATDTVFLGDSITEGGQWDELFPESNVRNRGIIGDTSTGILTRLTQITKHKPAQIFLMIGINDLSRNTPQNDIVANVVDIVERIHHDSPKTKVFVQSILPNAERLQQRIETINVEIEKAVSGKATWVNLYPLFLDESGVSMRDSLSNDDSHLLGQGYLIWRDAIAQLVVKRE